MVKLNRFTMPVFAGNAAQTQTSVFGTMKTSPQYTTDVAASIGTTAYGNGWNDAIDLGYAPFIEDMNTLQRAITYQISYNQQQGIPEWDANTEYYKGSLAKYNTATGSQVYSSLIDNNVGNLVSDATKWKLLFDTENSYVTTNTAQTITGAKTFQNAWPVFKTTAVAYTETPSSNVYSGLAWHDKNGDIISNFYSALYSGGSGATHLYLRNKAGAESRISLCYSSNGKFYTEAPTPTDTTTTSGTQIATTGWVNTVGNNVMHLDGAETITGIKTFTNSTRNRILSTENRTGTFLAQNMKYALGTTPSSDVLTQMQMRDSADDWAAIWEHAYRSDGGTVTSLSCRRANKSASSALSIGYQANGTVYTYAPASDVNNSIVTTAEKSKASKGYYKLGNGLIINWGYYNSGGTSGSINFAKSYTAYSRVVATSSYGFGDSPWGVNITTTTTSKFDWYQVHSQGFWWIAVGY